MLFPLWLEFHKSELLRSGSWRCQYWVPFSLSVLISSFTINLSIPPTLPWSMAEVSNHLSPLNQFIHPLPPQNSLSRLILNMIDRFLNLFFWLRMMQIKHSPSFVVLLFVPLFIVFSRSRISCAPPPETPHRLFLLVPPSHLTKKFDNGALVYDQFWLYIWPCFADYSMGADNIDDDDDRNLILYTRN